MASPSPARLMTSAACAPGPIRTRGARPSATRSRASSPTPSPLCAHALPAIAGPENRLYRTVAHSVTVVPQLGRPTWLPNPSGLTVGAEPAQRFTVPNRGRPRPISPSGFTRPLPGWRPPPAHHPKSIASSNSWPRITCHAAFASLQARAFIATGTLRRRFLRSYHAAIPG